jgi:hypothetical protein
MGNCLAGDTCIFSHDPSALVSRFNLDNSPSSSPNNSFLNSNDHASFPALNPAAESWPMPDSNSFKGSSYLSSPPMGYKQPYLVEHSNSRGSSRPSSRHQARDHGGPVPAVDDNEAFPSLGAGNVKGGKKHHGKRGHGHKDFKDGPTSLADVVRMAPASPSQAAKDANKSTAASRAAKNAQALAIPAPQHIPWLETGGRANKQYLHARAAAIKHGALRNKFLQSAQQAWSRNDARAAKALSLRGQSENDLMRKAHKEAARYLYEERNKHVATGEEAEIYVDLHGMLLIVEFKLIIRTSSGRGYFLYGGSSAEAPESNVREQHRVCYYGHRPPFSSRA